MDSAEALRSHDVTRACKHRFVPTLVCTECGLVPPKLDLVKQALAIIAMTTLEERLEILKRISIASK